MRRRVRTRTDGGWIARFASVRRAERVRRKGIECEDARQIGAALRRCDAQTTASNSTLHARCLERRNQHRHALASVSWSYRRLMRTLKFTPHANSVPAASDGGTCPHFRDQRTTSRNLAVATTTPASVEPSKLPLTRRQKLEGTRGSQEPSPLAKDKKCKRSHTQHHSPLVTQVASDTLLLHRKCKVHSHARKAFFSSRNRQIASISARTTKDCSIFQGVRRKGARP